MDFRAIFLVVVLCCSKENSGKVVKKNDGLTLSVIHFNDFHARFDEISEYSGVCKPEDVCLGGIARLATAINELRIIRKNPIVLNAGDSFQGTLYYNLFKWNITQEFLNLLPITAHTIGNHEFDDKIAGLVPFLKSLTAPVLVANINDSFHPEIQGLYKKSFVVEVDGKKIGIIGIILSTTNELSNTEKIIFTDEVEAMNAEAERLVEEEGAFTIVVLSHCGYLVDQEIAKNASKRIGLIVGAHSHTLLYNGTPPDNSTARGPYPTIVRRDNDDKMVLVVQASSYSRYLGDLVVKYDENGEVLSYRGNPVFLGQEIQPDPEFTARLMPYKNVVEAVGNEVLGETEVFLENTVCRVDECIFGNFITDAMVHCSSLNSSRNVSLALTNPGGIRTSLAIGNITFNDLMNAQPFENTFDMATFKGSDVKSIFERTGHPYAAFKYDVSVNLLQVSGFQVSYDLSRPLGDRVLSIRVKNPVNGVFEHLNPNEDYRIVFNSFLGNGGDGFKEIAESMRDYEIGISDVECLKSYIKRESPINLKPEGRLKFNNQVITNNIYYS